jgi:Ca-activated chloride channel family protein
MNIKNPDLLFLYAILIAVVFAFIYFYKQRKEIISSFKNSDNLKEFFKGFSLEKFFFRLVIWFAVLFFLITALVSPRFGYEWKEVNSVGANIIFAIDVSKSMLADDISPSRLARAKLEISKLIDKFQGDRSGLIIFARDAYLLTPLTHDYGIIKEWLGRTDTDSVSYQGTSIKSAISLAREAFAPIKSEGKALILISDGEEHDEETIIEAQGAFSEGIKIFTIGVGTQKGSPIQVNGRLLKDKNNQVVISKLDDTLLKEIAKVTESKYIRSTTGDFHLDQLYFNAIRKDINPEKLQSGMLKKWKETFQIFCIIAFIFLLIDTLLSLNISLSFKKLFRRKSVFEKGAKK